MHPDRFFQMIRLVRDVLDDQNITSISTYNSAEGVNNKAIVLVLNVATGSLFVVLEEHGFSTMIFPTYEDKDNFEVWVRDFYNYK